MSYLSRRDFIELVQNETSLSYNELRLCLDIAINQIFGFEHSFYFFKNALAINKGGLFQINETLIRKKDIKKQMIINIKFMEMIKKVKHDFLRIANNVVFAKLISYNEQNLFFEININRKKLTNCIGVLELTQNTQHLKKLKKEETIAIEIDLNFMEYTNNNLFIGLKYPTVPIINIYLKSIIKKYSLKTILRVKNFQEEKNKVLLVTEKYLLKDLIKALKEKIKKDLNIKADIILAQKTHSKENK